MSGDTMVQLYRMFIIGTINVHPTEKTKVVAPQCNKLVSMR